jgi:hypothetical protein
MGEGGVVSRPARGVAQAEGAQGDEEGSQEGWRQKAGGQKARTKKIDSEEIGGQKTFCEEGTGKNEEGSEKTVLILRIAPCARLEGWRRAPVAAAWFETRKMRSSP